MVINVCYIMMNILIALENSIWKYCETLIDIYSVIASRTKHINDTTYTVHVYTLMATYSQYKRNYESQNLWQSGANIY